MWVVDPIFRLLVSTVRMFTKYAIISLELFERVLRKFLTTEDWYIYTVENSDAEERLNGNGPDEPTPPTPSNSKRIKLLVDINISPGGSSKVVNVTTTDTMDETPPSRSAQFVSKCSLRLLFTSGALKNFLIEAITPRRSRYDTEHKNGRRRTISPRRRMSQMKRLIPQFPFRLLGIREPDTDSVIIVPQLNGDSERFARAQSQEKRKRPDSTSSNDSMYDAEVCKDLDADLDAPPPSPPLKVNGDVNKRADNGETSPIPNTSGGGPINDLLGSDSNASSSQEYGSPSSQLYKMLNIPEEEYESAEDSDYQPELSSTSSEESSSTDSDSSGRKLQQEVVDLEADIRALNEPLNRQVLGGIDDLELQNNPEDDYVGVEHGHDNAEANNEYAPIEPIIAEDLNEPEYSNGQASMRELIDRPVTPPALGVANRRHNLDDNTNNPLLDILNQGAAGDRNEDPKSDTD